MNILKVLTPRRSLGNLGENYAARLLKKKGYRILERNYIGKWGEIDIIAGKIRYQPVRHGFIGSEIGAEKTAAFFQTPDPPFVGGCFCFIR